MLRMRVSSCRAFAHRAGRTPIGLRMGVMLAMVAVGCVRSHSRPPVGLCPPLVVGEGALQTTYTAVVGLDTFAPEACVDVSMDGASLGRTFVTRDGTFALQLAIRGDARGRRAVVRIEDDEHRVRSLDIVIPEEPSQAEIAYEPLSAPLLVSEGSLLFDGWLAATPETVAPIHTATFVSWQSGAWDDISPTPPLDVPFAAEVPARVGACGTILSWHGANRWGGCWWPIGGNLGCTGSCTREDHEEGACSCTPEARAEGRCAACTGGRGCTPIEPDEPPRPPPPERDDEIPTAPPTFDAGTDAGMPDAFGDAVPS